MLIEALKKAWHEAVKGTPDYLSEAPGLHETFPDCSGGSGGGGGYEKPLGRLS